MEQQQQRNLITRDDTFLGVCEGLGEDLGIHGNVFRAGFAVALFFSPVATIAAYFGLGLLVLATRLMAPNPKRAPQPAEPETAEAVEAPEAASAPEHQAELAEAA